LQFCASIGTIEIHSITLPVIDLLRAGLFLINWGFLETNKGKDKMKSVYGIGVNDSDHPVKKRVDGERVWCPYYRRWSQMMARCYSPATLKRQKTYEKSSVCREWLRFSAFEEWMKNQIWDGMYLDKDILGDGTEYSPDNCAFVSRAANNLIAWRCVTGNLSSRTGVLKVSKARSTYFIANGCGERKRHRFYSEKEAWAAWLKNKMKRAEEIAKNEKDERVRLVYVDRVREILEPYVVG
jgi:hypothetical protein